MSVPCPVPREQQPISEYEELRQTWPFSWAALEKSLYSRKLFWVWAWSWLVVGPITAASFPPEKMPLQFFLCGAIGSVGPVLLFLTRIALGWHYIVKRLQDQAVVYEESGWYDGQVWEKPPEVLARDRLIASYQLQPIIQRLYATFVWVALGVGSGSLLWWLLPA